MQLDEQGSKMPEDESLSSGYPETSHSYSVKGNKIDDEEMIAATLRQRGEPSTGLVRGESGRAGTVTLKTLSLRTLPLLQRKLKEQCKAHHLIIDTLERSGLRHGAPMSGISEVFLGITFSVQ